MAEKDFTCNIKINGRDELDETIKKADQLVQLLEKAQELIGSLFPKSKLVEIGTEYKNSGEITEMKINDIAQRLVDVIENASVEKKQGIGDQKEELDLPHEILKLILDKSPEGVTVGETTGILNEARKLVYETLIV
ncbi:MAG: hypothetical protein K2O40_02865 [Lachnospiraceae bacterium]|nr:hypothetical protein [Lachnospiraceae bacterium]